MGCTEVALVSCCCWHKTPRPGGLRHQGCIHLWFWGQESKARLLRSLQPDASRSWRHPRPSTSLGLRPRPLVSASGVTRPSFPCLHVPFSLLTRTVTLEGVGIHIRSSQPGPAQGPGPQIPTARSEPLTLTSVPPYHGPPVLWLLSWPPSLLPKKHKHSAHSSDTSGDGQCAFLTSPWVVFRA